MIRFLLKFKNKLKLKWLGINDTASELTRQQYHHKPIQKHHVARSDSYTDTKSDRLFKKTEESHVTCNRTTPEENGGGWDLSSDTAEINLSVAVSGDKTAVIVLVSTVPSGVLKSASHPFMDIEHDIYFWNFLQQLVLIITFLRP